MWTLTTMIVLTLFLILCCHTCQDPPVHVTQVDILYMNVVNDNPDQDEGDCDCNPYNISQPGFSDLCSGDMFYESKFCYVTPDSRCGDKRSSRLYPSLYWSTEACGYPSSASSSSLSLSSSLFHQSWNFSSSYEECAAYCGTRERCDEGSIHVRFDTIHNICLMDSVPVGHLHLDHINPWL